MKLKTILKTAGFTSIILLASACGKSDENGATSSSTKTTTETHDMSKHDHDGHDMTKVKGGDIDHGSGTVVELDMDGRRIKLDHGELPNIGMNAMIMFFGIAGDVDLAGYEAGDEVQFMVKKGRDGSYRIMAMCDAATDGEDCLSALMSHGEH